MKEEKTSSRTRARFYIASSHSQDNRPHPPLRMQVVAAVQSRAWPRVDGGDV